MPSICAATERTGEAIDHLFDALARGDLAAARDSCTPDARIWHSFDHLALDLDAAVRGWEQFLGAFPERAFVDVRRSATRDGFVQQHLMVARTTGGGRRAWPICILVQVRDGRVARLDEYMDRDGSYPLERATGQPRGFVRGWRDLVTQTDLEAGLRPTRDLSRAEADFEAEGACIVLGALGPDMLAEVRSAVYRSAASDERRGWRRAYAYGKDDHVNQRLWNLPSRDPVFCDLAEHPMAMHFVRHVLGWPALLSSMSANITSGGGASMVLHADQGYMPQPWTRPHGINVACCVDDFAVENGATCFVRGSHRLNRTHRAEDATPLTPLAAPAGSMIVMDGRLWHTNGVNMNGASRAGIFSWYTLPIYLPQENWFLSLNPAVRQFGSETLQTLFGFRPQVMGRINGLERI